MPFKVISWVSLVIMHVFEELDNDLLKCILENLFLIFMTKNAHHENGRYFLDRTKSLKSMRKMVRMRNWKTKKKKVRKNNLDLLAHFSKEWKAARYININFNHLIWVIFIFKGDYKQLVCHYFSKNLTMKKWIHIL